MAPNEQPASIFNDASWYDRSINWEARLEREIPLLRKAIGPPGDNGILDAACGTGHQAVALACAGYRVTGLDASDDMLRLASLHAADARVHVAWMGATFDELPEAATRRFDGIYCIGNSLAAAGSAQAVRQTLRNFAAVLQHGGRLFIQVLNFTAKRKQDPCVLGPRISRVDDVEYVSFRILRFMPDHVDAISITAWNDGKWQQRAHTGRMYAVELPELRPWMTEAGLLIDRAWGDYQRTPFDPDRSQDLIVVATRS